jgi:hypothetical protein
MAPDRLFVTDAVDLLTPKGNACHYADYIPDTFAVLLGGSDDAEIAGVSVGARQFVAGHDVQPAGAPKRLVQQPEVGGDIKRGKILRRRGKTFKEMSVLEIQRAAVEMEC